MIAQPVVFARLAGFLAAHMSLGEDPLRRVMEALMLGYSEAEALDREKWTASGATTTTATSPRAHSRQLNRASGSGPPSW